ncbi:tyrosine-type recombinase/integrase [Hydrogenophaga sp. BPS33]|uniref:tyrosine-type recombinase/integrase n=1 Tax=Hydrogenophaga sp. BPS33 TaxID=2651974 RepID=UPI001916D118|nr:site-specific integrase [Hydrogenophaga sp. BPS33]
MGSITKTMKVDKSSGKPVAKFRAYVRRQGFASKSKVCDTEREAKEWIRNNDADAVQEKAVSGTTLASVIEDFTSAPAMKGTKYWSASHLDFWIAHMGLMRIGEISRKDINAAKAKLQNKAAYRSVPGGSIATTAKVTPATVNRYLASLSSVLNYAMEHEIIDAHPMKGGKVKKLTEGTGRTRILTAKEEGELLEQADRSTWPMLGLFVRMCLTTAARRSEVLNLRWKDVNFDESVAILGKTKNGKARALPLVTSVRAALSEAQKVKPLKSDFVFFNPRDPSKVFNPDAAWKQCRIDAGLWADRDDPLDRVVLHTTRHTSVTKMLRGGANLAQAAVVSGHQTLAMLKRYEHLAAADAVAIAEQHLEGKG